MSSLVLVLFSINRINTVFLLKAGREPQVSADHIKQFADCGFWDFAGQSDFYATHQTFLSGNAVYLLVVDISKDFTPNTFDKMIERKFDAIGGLNIKL